MSHYDQLPIEVEYNINHFIPYRNPKLPFIDEYKIFLQDWKINVNQKHGTV